MRNRLIFHRLFYWQVAINWALWYNKFTVKAEFNFGECCLKINKTLENVL